MNFKTWLEDDDYKGDHSAPSKENGAPMHDLTGIYPEDIYSPKGVRYYGDGSRFDYESWSILNRARNRPNMLIKVYRAIPAVITTQDKINDLEKQKRHILQYGRMPGDKSRGRDPKSSDYFSKISIELEKLLAISPDPKQKKIGINAGDWVTISRGYSKEHGQGNLSNKFKIISKSVPASTLYNDGNSIHEWGYIP